MIRILFVKEEAGEQERCLFFGFFFVSEGIFRLQVFVY